MKTKVKLAAIAKDEAAYIPQWIHHHLYFGFDEIEIWLNNTTDNSVELLTKLQKIHPRGVVKFKNADALLHKCLEENLQFQQLAYTEIYNEALASGEHSHILFLDLDEFWIPDNFSSNIHDFIKAAPEFDAMSFQWLIDTPDICKQIFDAPLSHINILQKNRHVKTLAKLTSQMRELSVHNHIIDNGKYLLADGQNFPGNNSETINRSLVPKSYLASRNKTLEKAFVLHQINRTPIEYLSSLLRGRGHKNDGNIFKANRIGYLRDNNSASPMTFKVATDKTFTYQQSLAKYYEPIAEHLQNARKFIIRRFYSAVEQIQANPELLIQYRDQLRGVKINDLVTDKVEIPSVFHSVDKTLKEGSKLFVEGWVFDSLSDNEPALAFEYDGGALADFEIVFNERPDVAKVYPDATGVVGFRATISLAASFTTLALVVHSSGGTQPIPLPTNA